jgi:hypothetical protein
MGSDSRSFIDAVNVLRDLEGKAGSHITPLRSICTNCGAKWQPEVCSYCKEVGELLPPPIKTAEAIKAEELLLGAERLTHFLGKIDPMKRSFHLDILQQEDPVLQAIVRHKLREFDAKYWKWGLYTGPEETP